MLESKVVVKERLSRTPMQHSCPICRQPSKRGFACSRQYPVGEAELLSPTRY